MNKRQYTRKLFLSLLIMTSVLALTQVLAIAPSYAQLGVASKTHTKGPTSSNNVTTISSVSPQTSPTGNGHGRHPGAVPPGLLNAWAHSNMSVVARAVTHAIFLNGTHGVELADIAINASSTGQLIRDVASNESVVKIDFDHDGSVELTVNSSAKPNAVYADDMELTEAHSPEGLNPNSEAWVYDQNRQVVTIFADPSSITLFYGPAPTPVPEFPSSLAGLILIGITAATMFVIKKKPKQQET